MIVTVWAVSQLAGVNVRLVVEIVPSVVSLEEIAIVTFAVGWLSRTTVKVSVPPASVVTSPLVGETVIPAALASSSVFVAETSVAFKPS